MVACIIRMLAPKAEATVAPIVASALTEAFASVGGQKCDAFNAVTFGAQGPAARSGNLRRRATCMPLDRTSGARVHRLMTATPSCIHQTLNTTASARPSAVSIAACTAMAVSTQGTNVNATCTAMGRRGHARFDDYLPLVCRIAPPNPL